jgi:hypothetical protein
VSKSGELISIHHAHVFIQSGEDLRKLFDFVGHDPKLLQVLGRVAGLTENDIRESAEAKSSSLRFDLRADRAVLQASQSFETSSRRRTVRLFNEPT